MPFFFIAPVWLLCVVAGVVTLFFRNMRRYGLFIIVASTSAMVLALALSTGVLLALVKIGDVTGIQGGYAKFVAIILYLISIPAGLFLGGVGGARLLKKVLPPVE
jgi:hypothetical protein